MAKKLTRSFRGRDRALVRSLLVRLERAQAMDSRRASLAAKENVTPVLLGVNDALSAACVALMLGCDDALNATS